ncbi:DUF736 domain-containing protein [Caulobacter segnis]
MSTIGIFTANADGSFTGDIDTLALKLKKVQIRPVADKASDNHPDYRITCGKANLGAAWLKTSEAGKVYRSVRLDDPSFGRPIDAILIEVDKVETMIWSRSNGSKEN